MKKTKKSQNNQTRLTKAQHMLYTLIAVLVFATLLLVGGTIYSYSFIKDQATEVKAEIVKRKESDQQVNIVNYMTNQLRLNKDAVDIAKKITVKQEKYQYQNKIIDVFDKIATESGLRVVSYKFEKSSNTATTSSQQSTQKTANPAASGAKTSPTAAPEGAPTAQKKAPAVQSTIVTMTLEGSLNYNALIRFMDRIEQNPTRTQIIDLSVKSDAKEGTNSLKIEVYTK